jgi:hypothetical protein
MLTVIIWSNRPAVLWLTRQKWEQEEKDARDQILRKSVSTIAGLVSWYIMVTLIQGIHAVRFLCIVYYTNLLCLAFCSQAITWDSPLSNTSNYGHPDWISFIDTIVIMIILWSNGLYVPLLLNPSWEKSRITILNQISPVHTTPSCLTKIHFSIIHALPSSWSLSF